MARALLGIAPARLDGIGQQLQGIGEQLFPHLATPVAGSWGLAWAPTLQAMRLRRAVATYNDLVQHLIICRRQAGIDTSATDLLARLITACDDQSRPYSTAQQLRDEVITFIGAGVETSALVLSWTCYLLARHPKVARLVKDEVDTVVGARAPLPTDLPRLVYGRMVLDEVMRLYPPAALLPRQANADDEIGGYTVPRHAVVLMSQYVTHRHPDFWPAPERFCPERFSLGRRSGQHRFAYFPFGEGPRICIGKPFALMEMHLALSTIAQTYRLDLVQNHPVVPYLATTLQPRGGLWMTVTPYS
jgi:cytochrome P450